MTKVEQIAQIIQTLAETYRVQLTAPAARAYVATLEDLSPAELREAGKRALRECEFMQPPAVLLRFALKARRDGAESMVAATDRMLEAMKPKSFPTDEELAQLRAEWKATVRKLAGEKS